MQWRIKYLYTVRNVVNYIMVSQIDTVNYICHLMNSFVVPSCSLSRICCENRTESVAQLVKNSFTPLRSSPPVVVEIRGTQGCALFMMTSSNGNIFRVIVPAQRPATRSFDIFFVLRLKQHLSKQWRRWWFETLLHSLWRHCNVFSRQLCNRMNTLYFYTFFEIPADVKRFHVYINSSEYLTIRTRYNTRTSLHRFFVCHT